MAAPKSPQPGSVSSHSDSDNEKGRTKEESAPRPSFWHKMGRVPFATQKSPPPPPKDLDASAIIPEVNAGWLSLLTFEWITPLMTLGYNRPLEAADLYKLQDDRASAYIADKILASFEARQEKARVYNARLDSGEIKPGFLKGSWWSITGKRDEKEKHWREVDARKKASLVWAMNDAVKWWFWSGLIIKIIGDTAQTTSPLLVKALITFASESYGNRRRGEPVPNIGVGVGMAIGLFLLQLVASLGTHHFFYRSSSTGVLLRGGMITAIYNRSLKLSSRARSTLTNGKLVNHISTDVSRIDFACGFAPMAITAPIQIVVCLAILIVNLGPSALTGFGLFLILTPLQTWIIKNMFVIRGKSMKWTDARAKLLQELFGGMKIVKFFGWEIPFRKRVFDIRQKEMSYVRTLLLIRSANNALAMSLPALASVLAFMTYTLTGHSQDPAVIFASLTLFNLLRFPLMFLPVAFSAIADAKTATDRLYDVFVSETLDETHVEDASLEFAVEVTDASFTWDAPPPEATDGKKKKGPEQKQLAAEKAEKAAEKLAMDEKNVFKMDHINLNIPRGKLVAFVGPVGAGKTSLLQGLIGEMRRTSGEVKFGGSVGYCPQSAWIQNATIRENVCFGRPFDETKYWKAIKDASLDRDLELFPNGDATEVGEKGISLSGGQKQRINICRAIYAATDIQIFDDPLSALDAHVGKAVFQNVLQNNTTGTTRILVTHALHFLPQVDYIYNIQDGRLEEHGTYAELIANADGMFSKFMAEFASNEAEEEQEKEQEAVEKAVEDTKQGADEEKLQKPKAGVAGVALMQVEERNTGAIDGSVYKEYLSAGRGGIIMPLLVASLVLMQGTTVMSSYWLVYWQEDRFNQREGFYLGIYAGLGVGQAVAAFFMGATFALLTFFASQKLHQSAVDRVMHAPLSFYETTPLGRIMNRFSKDVDTVDNLIGDALRMFFATFSNILGAVVLVGIVLPWFLIAMFAISIVYYYAALFYRASARELKRLDSLLRSSLYSHFSESLSGLATIRAYGETERFRLDNEQRVDANNRAYWLTITNQRWLGIRVDFLGSVLTLAVALLAVGTRFSISPAKTGLVLSYILSVQAAFSWMVRQASEVENNFNSVERLVHYAREVEQEAAYEIPEKKPAAPWPAHGQVELKNIKLSYRPELPPVLNNLSMSVKGGEKIGIVGRTGAGKSSLMTALYRLVELTSGSIIIDGVDISTLGLKDLRASLAIIPQEAGLFSGTLRTNLDPFGLYDDVKLWDALKRAYLVDEVDPPSRRPSEELSGTGPAASRFNLDTVVEDEGNNLSIGQRSLVSLARALVKDSKILILDEATASVDYETDRRIQSTIATEFNDRTILCIAHRLRTIIGYDRICVLDAGEIAEYDKPEVLYAIPDGIFRGMCERSSISLEDIHLAQAAINTSTTTT